MLPLQKILLAKDFSRGAEQALRYALDLAGRTGAELHTIYAEVIHGDSFEAAKEPATQLDKLREQLRRQWEEAPNKPGYDPGSLRVKHEVVRDVAAAPAILQYAEDEEVDLIVMGTHGRRGVGRLLLGSVAAEVVRQAPCPVMTVSLKQPAHPQEMAPLLVPVDFSQHNRSALRAAKHLAVLYDAPIELLHVVQERLYPDFYSPTPPIMYETRPEVEEHMLQRMKELYREVGGPAVEAKYSVRAGQAGSVIGEFAEKKPCGLVVMSTHGRTGLKRFAMGSVAEKVVRTAPCPVLTLRAFGRPLVPAEEADAPRASGMESTTK